MLRSIDSPSLGNTVNRDNRAESLDIQKQNQQKDKAGGRDGFWVGGCQVHPHSQGTQDSEQIEVDFGGDSKFNCKHFEFEMPERHQTLPQLSSGYKCKAEATAREEERIKD